MGKGLCLVNSQIMWMWEKLQACWMTGLELKMTFTNYKMT